MASKATKLLTVLAVAALAASCGTEPLPTTQQVVTAYFERYPGEGTGDSLSASPDRRSAYFDLSNGIVAAYQSNPGAAQLLSVVVNLMTAREGNDIYKVVDNRITPLSEKQTGLYNIIMSPASYEQQMAPIEPTLQQIVREGRSALLVTDFEEYTADRVVQHQAFAARYFTQWLLRGGDITFFVFDYTEGTRPKHLYFTVFDGPSHALLQSIEEQMDGIGGARRFCLSRRAFTCFTRYPSATQGGTYRDADGLDIVSAAIEDGDAESYFRLGDGQRMEFYPLGVTWSDILGNARAMQEPGVEPPFRHLLGRLYFDFSCRDSYSMERLRLRVTDVEEDYQRFFVWQTALMDANKGKAPYYDEPTGQLSADYAYRPAPCPEIKDFLQLDDALLQQTLKQNGGRETEVAVQFAPQFGGTIVGGRSGDLYRVDVVVEKAVPNVGPQLDALFAWGQNTNLADAVRNTLHQCNPAGTTVYTYFLRAQ